MAGLEGAVFFGPFVLRGLFLSSPGRVWLGRMDEHDKLRSTLAVVSSQPGSVDQVARWSETPVAFARWYLCGIETAVAFAGEKWAFLVRFLGAEVMWVSRVPCCGCAVVLLVSRSPCF